MLLTSPASVAFLEVDGEDVETGQYVGAQAQQGGPQQIGEEGGEEGAAGHREQADG